MAADADWPSNLLSAGIMIGKRTTVRRKFVVSANDRKTTAFIEFGLPMGD